jgi:RNA polymerase sigma-32 factor
MNRKAAQTSTSLNSYLKEIRRHPLLTRVEEKELACRYREREDLAAAHRLINANLRLVVKIAMQFGPKRNIVLADLIQEGNLGLVHAVKKYDPDKGTKFSYYAAFWIKAFIYKHVMANWSSVKVGTTQAQRKLFYNLRKQKRP